MRLTDADYLHEIFFESAQFDTYKDYSFVLDEIDLSPTIDAVPVRRGHWVKVSGYVTPGGDPVWKCSECGKGTHIYGIEASSYQKDVSDQQWVSCPNCGADMREE